MKLYATTSSERATKGQGGNKKLEVNLTIDSKERKEIGNIIMTYDEIEGYLVYYYPVSENCKEQKINNGRVLLYQEKGEKEKGECKHKTYREWANGQKTCNDCGFTLI